MARPVGVSAPLAPRHSGRLLGSLARYGLETTTGAPVSRDHGDLLLPRVYSPLLGICRAQDRASQAADSRRLSQRLVAHIFLLVRGLAAASSGRSLWFPRFASLDCVGSPIKL